jgi:hypothetical protein
MIRNFLHYFAWTDTVKYKHGYAGLIGYRHKDINGPSHKLWVIGPNLKSETEAEMSADRMLYQIHEITYSGRVVYNDEAMF